MPDARTSLSTQCGRRVVPQQWLARANTPGIDPEDRRRFDFVIHGAALLGEAWCCDVTLVSPPAGLDGTAGNPEAQIPPLH